jgi:SAM-dependent methyltransferase
VVNRCPACGAADWEPGLDKGPFRYLRCRECGIGRLDPFPSPNAAVALYDDAYFQDAANAGYHDYLADENLHRRNGRARVRRLGPPPPRSQIMVDIGCAFGFTMVEARDQGWTPMGVEANAGARAHVAALGMRCEPDRDALGLAPHSVGAVTFYQVLEHLTDPLDALRWTASVLAPGGRVAIETWDRASLVARLAGSRWQVATPPSVLWLWDRHSLRSLARAAGLELVGFSPSTKWVSAGLVAGQLRGRGGAGPLVRMGERIQRVPLPYALGDLVSATLVPVV